MLLDSMYYHARVIIFGPHKGVPENGAQLKKGESKGFRSWHANNSVIPPEF